MRTLLLIFGPLVIVGLCYSLALHGREQPAVVEFRTADNLGSATPKTLKTPSGRLSLACQRQAELIRRQIDDELNLVVRSPYIIAGDFETEELDRYHSLLIKPTQQALSTDYFDQPPTQPITVFLFSTEQGFEEHARQTDRRSVYGEYGYYHHDDRRIVINAATGNGTLAHELTHALAHFDFPAIPAWFDEGLAALHEGCEFSDDGLHLNGLSNWRINVLCEAIGQARLDSIESLVAKQTMTSERADIDYAHARYFCLYLQSRRLLAPFYRKFRSSVDTDPTGIMTLRQLLQADSLAKTNADFESWVLSLNQHATSDDL